MQETFVSVVRKSFGEEEKLPIMSFDHGNLLLVFLTLIMSLHRCGESERYVIYPSCGIEVHKV
jgi:hypothetical protein